MAVRESFAPVPSSLLGGRGLYGDHWLKGTENKVEYHYLYEPCLKLVTMIVVTILDGITKKY